MHKASKQLKPYPASCGESKGGVRADGGCLPADNPLKNVECSDGVCYYTICTEYALLAQLGEHLGHNQVVRGSSPLQRTIKPKKSIGASSVLL